MESILSLINFTCNYLFPVTSLNIMNVSAIIALLNHKVAPRAQELLDVLELKDYLSRYLDLPNWDQRGNIISCLPVL
jgi:hypothetical protein